MLTLNDQRKVDYCKENNKGICPYIHKVCDGLCNNCGLDAIAEKCDRIVPARNWWNMSRNWWNMNEDAEKLINYDTEE